MPTAFVRPSSQNHPVKDWVGFLLHCGIWYANGEFVKNSVAHYPSVCSESSLTFWYLACQIYRHGEMISWPCLRHAAYADAHGQELF
jgi:hypothetical protein